MQMKEAQFVFLKGNEKPKISYAKRRGKYMKQKALLFQRYKYSLDAKTFN